MSHSPEEIKAGRQYLRQTNRQYPEHLVKVGRSEWPPGWAQKLDGAPVTVWRSRKFVAMLYSERGHDRLTVNRSELNGFGGWKDGITWDEMMALKSEAGYGHAWAIEIFPPEDRLINVANMRHLWLLEGPPSQAWL